MLRCVAIFSFLKTTLGTCGSASAGPLRLEGEGWAKVAPGSTFIDSIVKSALLYSVLSFLEEASHLLPIHALRYNLHWQAEWRNR